MRGTTRQIYATLSSLFSPRLPFRKFLNEIKGKTRTLARKLLHGKVIGSEDLHFSPAPFSAQNFGKFSSDHHETPSSSIVANEDDLESRDNVLEKSLRSNVAKFRFT